MWEQLCHREADPVEGQRIAQTGARGLPGERREVELEAHAAATGVHGPDRAGCFDEASEHARSQRVEKASCCANARLDAALGTPKLAGLVAG
ncbi:MAG: hypothetical protein DHS20C15_03740 [Planctomycetota bacterium]|nr:MAG: hypothetical protein DHS20C15_03740 [Planctomycetota bacterium]